MIHLLLFVIKILQKVVEVYYVNYLSKGQDDNQILMKWSIEKQNESFYKNLLVCNVQMD